MSENFNEQNNYENNSYGSDENQNSYASSNYGDRQSNYGDSSYGSQQSTYGNNQNTYGYGSQGQYQYQPETGRYEEVPQPEMSIGKWLLTFLLCAIPVVNLVMLIIWAVGNNPKDAIRKTWAKAQLIWMVIIAVLSTILTIALGSIIAVFFANLAADNDTFSNVWAEEYMGEDDADRFDIYNHDSEAATLPDTSEDRPVVDAEPMDGTWEDMSFFFDGHEYSLPFAYSEIEANGWTFDIADYGYEDGYVMNAGDQTYESIELKNPDYPDVTVKIGFVNLDSSAKDITECDIYAFSLDTCYGFDQVDAFPIMSVSGGLTIGMDEQSAVAIMGECDDVYEAEEYNSYSYQDEEYNRHLDFEVNDENGITYFDLTYYQ